MRALYETARWRARMGLLYLRAHTHRLRLSGTCFIGITGSAGKTTTKDLTSAILSNVAATSTTLRSANMPESVAETVLCTPPETRYCVAELAGFKPGALDFPLRLVRPSIGAITCIGDDHTDVFVGREGIAREKAKLIAALPTDGTAVLNIDDPLVRQIGSRSRCKVVWVGNTEGATIRLISATSIWPKPLSLTIEHGGQAIDFHTRLHGTQLAPSILSALGIAVSLGITIENAVSSIQEATPYEGRMEVVADRYGVTFIRDDWKAPYWSAKEPLKFLRQTNARRKVAVIGTLTYFTEDPAKVYERLASEAQEFCDLTIFVGAAPYHALRRSTSISQGATKSFVTAQEAADYLRKELEEGDVVLIKGSNKAGHLGRLVLDRIAPIECWRDDCGLPKLCSDCSRLYARSSSNVEVLQT